MIEVFKTTFEENRDLFTLIWLITIIIIYPYLETFGFGNLLLGILITGFLLSALYSVSDRPIQVAVGLLLAIPTLLCSWTHVIVPTPQVWIASLVTMLVFLVYILLAILFRVVSAKEVTLVEIYRAVVIYIVIGFAFAMLYLLTEILMPNSFQFSSGGRDPEALIYFSFVAISTSGFGDITAISPIARSMVTIELLIGVMYMAVLIGLLVNAHYTTRYSRPEERWKGEGKRGRIRKVRLPLLSSGGPLTIIAISVMLNLATSLLAVSLSLPIFLDSWGTSFGVMVGGLPVGIVVGILFNLVMALTVWSLPSFIFVMSSLLVAFMTWIFWTRGWIDVKSPFRLIGAGIITGLLNALLVIILITIFHFPMYEGTSTLYSIVSEIVHNPSAALCITEVIVEVVDKSFCLILAAVAAVFYTDFIEKDAARGESGATREQKK